MEEELHLQFMKECLQLSKQALNSGNVPYSALIVKDGEVLAGSYNRVFEYNDPIAHGEMVTIKEALSNQAPKALIGASLYSSNEPCPMCTGAAIWSGFSTIVYGASQEALMKLHGRGYFVPSKEICERDSSDIEVIGPIMESEFVDIHKAFRRSNL